MKAVFTAFYYTTTYAFRNRSVRVVTGCASARRRLFFAIAGKENQIAQKYGNGERSDASGDGRDE